MACAIETAPQLPARAWLNWQRKEGIQGSLAADFAVLRVVMARRAPAGPDVWLLLRRHPQTAQLKTYPNHGPPEITSAQLVWMVAMRWPIEPTFWNENSSWA